MSINVERLRELSDKFNLAVYRGDLLSIAHAMEALERDLAAAKAEREKYRVWWERDSKSLSVVIGERNTARAVAEDRRAQLVTAEAERDALRDALDCSWREPSTMHCRHDSPCKACLLRERDALRADAERYRWLRRRTTLGVGMVNIWSKGDGRYEYRYGDDLDAAIDAARKAK